MAVALATCCAAILFFTLNVYLALLATFLMACTISIMLGFFVYQGLLPLLTLLPLLLLQLLNLFYPYYFDYLYYPYHT